ncbi:MAG: Proline-tRNA ligase, partial [Candidatus Peribacteria bacterium GW2011_GWB1_54_5]
VRGDYDVNEAKLRAVLGCKALALAPAAVVKEVTGAEVGYAGPIGLPENVRVVWDESTAGRRNFECGANKTGEHSVNVNFGRDIPEPKEFFDIKVAREGDADPKTEKEYTVYRGSEVGNVFTLYTKFSDSFGFKFMDKDGKEKPVYMGCYGIGTTRVLGVLAEVFHDEHGVLWPENVATKNCRSREWIASLKTESTALSVPAWRMPISSECQRELWCPRRRLQTRVLR